MNRPPIVIVTPALAQANNGNWQTAQRWAQLLGQAYRVRVTDAWTAVRDDNTDDALMIALHARRSAASVAAWRDRRGAAPLIVALTGTDLYHDIFCDASAQASVQAADRLIVLNALGGKHLPASAQRKTQVVLQSCESRPALTKPAGSLHALMVGHLREEKSPQTFFDAVDALAMQAHLRFSHIGDALDPALGRQARALMARCPQYQWLGPLPHPLARLHIQQAHVLVHPSRLEGGAHVITEAIRSGTAVLASQIDGNVGLLGEHYGGYFPVGDAHALAALLNQLHETPAMLAALSAQCETRAELFAPDQEAATLNALVHEVLRLPRSTITSPSRPG